MASALLASRNEPYWGDRKVYMRKTPNSNPNSRAVTNPNPNPNARDHVSDHTGQFHPLEPEEVPASVAAVSDDSSSFNRKCINLNHRRDSASYITFNISNYSKTELRELKRRLASELEQVRSLSSRIESREFQSSARSAGFSSSGIYCGGREVTSLAAAALHQNHVQPPDSQAARSSDLFSTKEKKISGNKTLLPVVSPREAKRLAAAPGSEKLRSAMMKKCGQILTKLMKHKKGIWFNSPVDVVGMGLHDYFQIIKHPMDLGTVKSKLNKGLYPSPLEFAADIRLTFNNALLYNPEGHEVHKLADQFLRLFEGLFRPSYEKYEKQQSTIAREEEEGHRVVSWSRPPVVESAMRPEPVVPMILPPALNPTPMPTPSALPPVQAKQPQLLPQPQQHPVVGRMMMGKQPKPKATYPKKRPMSLEEKTKLSLGLQSLPQEKMSQVLQIVRKRNADPAQQGDEIELDIETMDMVTLWELDRFLYNCKKMMSKIKRQDMASHLISAGPPATMVNTEGGDRSPVAVETPEAEAAKKSKKADTVEEDVDIGDEMPCTNYPSVEIEKDAGCASSSSSSSSGSSSSSDSDSGSSSECDSDRDDAQSPAVGLRSPRN
ncbi:transcription factor GTE7-like [Phoenix dactylifera]|uniref:Transcription factor GTE7-like n=1 Tax=Phoenix dactylifera TaxID=42345 RepID=A0A8B7BMS4_PHODC|nr:transcription factor GTE7-like [Phoenix dactylifera]XP_038984373.1 transcription factor GTE7-like [Phoenix dactylifera]